MRTAELVQLRVLIAARSARAVSCQIAYADELATLLFKAIALGYIALSPILLARRSARRR
jgi:hypothetical protein